MFAVIKTGGKQYKVAQKDVLRIEKIVGVAGDIVQFNEVLLLGGKNACCRRAYGCKRGCSGRDFGTG